MVLVLLCLLMNGCAKGAEQKLKDTLRRAVSATATVLTVGEWWSKGLVPTAYAAGTLERMSTELEQEIAEIDSISSAAVEQRLVVNTIQEMVAKMATEIRQNHRAALFPLLDQLKGQHTILITLNQPIPKQ